MRLNLQTCGSLKNLGLPIERRRVGKSPVFIALIFFG